MNGKFKLCRSRQDAFFIAMTQLIILYAILLYRFQGPQHCRP